MDAATRNIKLVIAYQGRAYHGWQRQAAGIDTVQERIEAAATRVLKHPVTVHGAGRTDAGVHAAGQVANLHTPALSVPMDGLRRAMNSRLPPDIAVRSATVVPESFHASKSAIGKTYQYRLCLSPNRPVDLAGRVWHYWQAVDVPSLRDAAARLVGRHDFAGFATSGDQRATTVRSVFRCDIEEDPPDLRITVDGDGFLYNQVRNMVGTLMEIARAHWAPDRIDRILHAADRRLAGPTAPPDGLSLLCVHYRPEDLRIPETSQPQQTGSLK